MSLDFDVSRVVDVDSVCRVTGKDGGTDWAPVTQEIVFMAMAIGLYDLDAPYVDEWLCRISAWRKLYGSMFRIHDTEHPEQDLIDVVVTRDDLVRHIGLRTNTFPALTPGQFAYKLYGAWAAEHRGKQPPRSRRR